MGKRETIEQHLDGMMDSDMKLYEQILDTPGFAYPFGRLVNMAQLAETALVKLCYAENPKGATDETHD